MRHKRVIASRTGGPEVLEVVEEEIPEPASGQVRVRVLRAGVAFGDILWQSGKVPGGPKPPYTPGYDLVGIVDKLGPGVAGVELGARVAALVRIGGYSEVAIVPSDYLHPVPADLDPSEVICLTLNYITGYQLFRRIVKMIPGNRVLIHGAAGGVGTAMLQLGKLMDLEMYGTASAPKHELVSSLGATPIDYRNEDFVERVLDITGDGVDLVVDHIGGDHLNRSFRTLRPGGTLISTSAYASVRGEISSFATMLGALRMPLWNLLPNKKSAILFDVVPFNRKNLSFFGEDLDALLGHLSRGEIDPIIATQMPLSEAKQAQEMLLAARAQGKVVLICNEQ